MLKNSALLRRATIIFKEVKNAERLTPVGEKYKDITLVLLSSISWCSPDVQLEASRRNNNWLPPPWEILALVVLGFNEFMTLLRNPLYLGVIFVAFVLVKAMWVQPDISGEFQNGAGSPIPSLKALKFDRPGTFTIDAQYADVSELQVSAKISTHTIGPFNPTKSEHTTLKVKVCLNLQGIVSVESATMFEEEEAEVPIAKEAAKMDIDESMGDSAPTAIETDRNMKYAPGA